MPEELIYVSASANRFAAAADVSPSSFIAFGTQNLISLWDTTDENDRGVCETLTSDQGTITSLKFVSNDILVSGDDKGVLKCWNKRNSQVSQSLNLWWVVSGRHPAHSQSISTICVYGSCIVSGSSDSTIKIWEMKVGHEVDFQEIQTLSTYNRLPLVVALERLPGSEALVLAVGDTKKQIQMWTRSESMFVKSAVLSGHEDWVKSLAFKTSTLPDGQPQLVLASGSNDASIRLWNVDPIRTSNVARSPNAPDSLTDELLDEFEASLGELAEGEEGSAQISLKRHVLTVKSKDSDSNRQFSITFDALLVGHEAGITSLAWKPGNDSVPTLMSSSTDSSIILWSPSSVLVRSGLEDAARQSTSIWINCQRFGDVGGQRLGGFVGSLWACNGSEALAWGWQGGWRRWRCSAVVDTSATSLSDSLEMETWTEVGAVSGHHGPVKDLSWSPDGNFLISAGSDQTTRIHGAIPHPSGSSWHEIGRPQVHGYDLTGVCFLDPLKFVSIADEKVARVFEAPNRFVSMVEGLGIARFGKEEHERPQAASVPPLGLSNKALEKPTVDIAVPLDSSIIRRPFDGELQATTLWPEVEKVFGHGYELISIAASTSRALVATACKATSPDHAVVRIYDSTSWKLHGSPLSGHSLTVTGIRFSPDDRYVLTVSRDRSWRLFETQGDTGYLPVAAVEKAHGRIIWDCAWSIEGDIFVTASRDKTVKVWKQTDLAKGKAISTLRVPEAATAVDFLTNEDKSRLLAVGLETGDILVYKNNRDNPSEWILIQTVAAPIAHAGHIYRLLWKPDLNGGHLPHLASCSEDGTVKILAINTKTQ
ncbi:WD40 repeat-like protein [Fistulina hepatica ATCC 64428]|uniref:Elongator complex protein 2 n=1 Tax=Fistulina hepatica ATCC 64428 TaxID=1128425 RepID=A0A0D7ALD8_9AGAR|nr:WD40 repeat-like protein [Fistulina hepatica ATCC 64428]